MKAILHQFVRNLTATFLKKKTEGITESNLGKNTPGFFKYAEKSHLKVALFLSIALFLISIQSQGQSAPAAQTLPYSQNFGTTTFTALPSGLASWNGALKTTQALALTGTYTGNAVIATATAATTTGGAFGYATVSNGRLYIQESGNATNGTNALVVAINTGAATSLTIQYQLELISGGATTQDFGLELVYRAGTAGAWTAVPSSTITFGAVTTYTTQTLSYAVSGLAASTDYQFRWATWRPTGSGASKGIGIDNISIFSATTPSISTTGSLAAVNTTYGTASATPTSFNVSGINITGGILVTPPAGYEVCLTTGGTYTTTVTVGTTGTVPSTQVFVRLKAVATVAGSPYFGNIVCSSSGATNVNVATVSSTVSQKGVTISGATASSKIYDRSTLATITGATAVGIVNGDGITVSGNGTFNNFNAGTAKPVTTSLTLNGTNASSYLVTQPTGLTANITVKNLTIVSILANNKVYDSNTSAIISGNLNGVISPDDVSLILSASFSSPFVAVNIPVNSDSSLTGAAIANYILVQPTGLTANITPKPLTILGAAASNKVHDGNTNAVITGTLTGIIAPDSVTLHGTGIFASAAVGTNIPVTSTSTISGDISNYTLTQPTGLTANITAAPLVAQNITFNPLADAVYGDANFLLTATSSSGLTVTYTSSDPSIATIVAGASPGTYEVHIVGVGFTSITATQSGDATYDSATPVSQFLNVTQKQLTVTESAADKVYDGNDIAVVTGTLQGIVVGDDVTFSGSGNFASISVGTGIQVYPTSTLGGVNAGNYFISENVLSASITPKTLTVIGATAGNKTYNGNTTAAITGGSLQGVIAPDVVTFGGTGVFASKDVANGIAVTASLSLGGANAGNYMLTQPSGLTANITPLALTISGLLGVDKVYDRATVATLSGTAALVGAIAPDDVSLSGTITAFFNNKTVGTAKPISVFGYTLAGTQSTNYTVTQPTGLTGNVTIFSLTIFNAAGVSKVHDGSTAATITGTLVGTLGADVVTLNGTGTFASAAVGSNIAVSSTSTIGGTDGPNYIINPQPTGLTANITAAPTYLGTQDFEAIPATPTLTFTTVDSGTVNAGSGFVTGQTTVSDSPSGANYFSGGSRGYQVYPTTNPASRVITFSSVDASTYTNLQASFRIASLSVGSTGNGIDSTTGTTILGAATPVDFALIEVSPDGGITWYKQAVVSTSGSNARYAFTGTGTGTRSYAANNSYSNYIVAGSNALTGNVAITTALVTSLPAVSALAIRITLQSNASSEHWVIDDVNISGNIGSACTMPDSVTSLAATNGSSSSVVSWNYGSCYDESLVVASSTAFTSAVPTGDGTAYSVTSQSYTDTGNSSFDGGKVVYKGAASATTITSLINGTAYNFKVFVRKGINWTLGDITSATPVEAQYFWDADGATTATMGGTGNWDSAATSNWRTPNAAGTLAAWVTNTTPLNATIAGTAGIITFPSSITTPLAPNLYINTTGYTFTSTGATAITVPALNTVLANDVHLTFVPNVNISLPASGSFNMGNISAGTNSGITLNAAQSTTGAISQRINLSRINTVVTTPITIVSAGGTGVATVAALVATAAGTSLSSTATINNNTAIKTGLGATSGSDLAANGVISGTADLMFAAGASGGTGTVTLNIANTYTGATLFNLATGGIVKLGATNALPPATNLTMAYSTANGGIFDLNGFNQTIASLSNGAGGGSIRNNAVATDAALTVNSATSTTFGLAINDGTSKVALLKAGIGTLTLSSISNSYTGGTTISGGALQLGAAGVLANGGAIVLNGGALNTAGFSETVGTLNLNSTGTILLGVASHSLTFANSSAVNWTGSLLVVNGWTGTAGQSNTSGGKIFVGAGGLNLTQLSKVSFSGYAGSPIILASGELVPTGPHLIVSSGSLNHGTACVGNSSSFIEYTISNSGATAAGVNVVSNNPEFVVTNAPTEVVGGSSATYRITFTPSGAGTRTASITITSTTPNGNTPVISSLSGAGNAYVTYYADEDGDTYGNSAIPLSSCSGAPIYLGHAAVLNSTDCNDGNASVYQNGNLFIDADGDGYTVGTATATCYGATVPTGYSLTSLGTDCDDTNAALTNNCTPATTIVNLTLFIEGYYTFGGEMSSVKLNQGVGGASSLDVENIVVELRDPVTLALAGMAVATLHTNGTATATFSPAISGSYYIAIKTINAIQTWSGAPMTVGANAVSYSFTTSASQAYGNNMVEVEPGKWAFFSGDMDQDGSVNPLDYSIWEADANDFAGGVFATDLDGDGSVNPLDYSVWEANANNFVGASIPTL